MNCLKCKDEKVIWQKDKLGNVKCFPCPECNPNGKEIREKINKMEREK